jgi:L-amino acid N-acyltransferase YncA
MPASGAGVRIEAMTGAHAAAVLAIYQAGIDEGNATFETQAPAWEEFTGARLACHRYVAVTGMAARTCPTPRHSAAPGTQSR